MAGVFIADTYIDALVRLPRNVLPKVSKALQFLRRDRRHPGLNFESLHRGGLCSIRVDQQYRIILRDNSPDPALLYVGNHDDAYRFAARTPEWQADYEILLPVSKEGVHSRRETPIGIPGGAALGGYDYFAGDVGIGLHPARTQYVVPSTPASFDAVDALGRTPKYLPLASLLVRQPTGTPLVEMKFAEVEKAMEAALPRSANTYRAWWANDASHVQAAAWLAVGWRVESVDLVGRIVTFKRGSPTIAKAANAGGSA